MDAIGLKNDPDPNKEGQINASCKEENNYCFDFAFNRNNSILAVGCLKEIVFYEFNMGAIGKELQRLSNHTGYVTCLQFMNKSDCVISGGCDYSIIIWEYDYAKSQYNTKQIFQAHLLQINCIIISKNDDLLIIGLSNQIKFWSIINNSWSCRQTIYNQVQAISLNEFEDKLISSCQSNKFISVITKGNDDQWSIVQQININSGCVRLCFTLGDQFFFKPTKGDKLQIYNYNQKTQKFEIINNIKLKQERVKIFFPCQYIQETQILSVRYGPNVNLFKVNQEGNYQLIQQIQFKSSDLLGRLTNDGKYLVTWDDGSKLIQVRELKYQL